MKKIISYWFFVVFSLFLVVETSAFSTLENHYYKNETITYNYTERVCIHDELMIPNCELSVNKDIKHYYKNKVMHIYNRKDLILSCSIVGFTRQTIEELKTFINRCRNTPFATDLSSNFYIYVKTSPDWKILNSSMDFIQEFEFKYIMYNRIYMIGFKGFDIESPMNLYNIYVIQKRGRFDLYARGRLVNGCHDYFAYNTTMQELLFNRNNINVRNTILQFYYSNSKVPVCSVFFKHARFFGMYFFNMINSFYFKKIITFEDPSWFHGNHSQYNDIYLDSKIRQFGVKNFYGLDIDSRLLNPFIFAAAINLELDGHLNSISDDAFKPFRNITSIRFSGNHVVKVIRKQGIDWIKQINTDVNVTLSNIKILNLESIKPIFIRFSFLKNEWIKKFQMFGNEDFCLLVDYPFHRLIFIIPVEIPKDTNCYMEFSCTEMWLYQFSNIYRDSETDDMKKAKNNSNFSACDFPTRIDLCRKSHFHINSIRSTQNKITSYDVVAILELIFVILVPTICSLGIVTNLITIIFISHKNNKETMREKHYLYLSAYCISNIIIFFTQILALMNECQLPYGFYCSSIHRVVFVQYIKIIFGEYLNSACRLFSNFAYLGFSVCRLAKIGKDHGKVIVAINDLNIKTFIIISLIISAGLSVCKFLQYKILYLNPYYDFELYPLPRFQSYSDWINRKNMVAIFALNIVFNVINYFLFVCVHLIVDIFLIKKLVVVLREKEEKMREMKKSDKEMEEASKQNEESKRRALFMVVLNSTINLITRLPLVITSLNELRYFIYHQQNTTFPNIFKKFNGFDPSFSFKSFCSNSKSCLAFNSFGNCLFLLSITTILFFLKHFDNNFKKAYQEFFTNSNKGQKNK